MPGRSKIAFGTASVSRRYRVGAFGLLREGAPC
jgi:hypothetical protein